MKIKMIIILLNYCDIQTIKTMQLIRVMNDETKEHHEADGYSFVEPSGKTNSDLVVNCGIL